MPSEVGRNSIRATFIYLQRSSVGGCRLSCIAPSQASVFGNPHCLIFLSASARGRGPFSALEITSQLSRRLAHVLAPNAPGAMTVASPASRVFVASAGMSAYLSDRI